MLLKVISLLISALLLSQSTALSTGNQSKAYDDAEAYEVYSTILPTEWPWREAKAKTLIIHSETRSFSMCLKPEPESEKIIGQAISEYVRLNDKAWLLQPHFKIEKSYELITPNELKAAFEQGDWERFYQKYPDSGGWIELSAVGFNTDKTVAVVYMGHHCGGLCGRGGFHVLQKKDGKWIPLNWNGRSCFWVS